MKELKDILFQLRQFVEAVWVKSSDAILYTTPPPDVEKIELAKQLHSLDNPTNTDFSPKFQSYYNIVADGYSDLIHNMRIKFNAGNQEWMLRSWHEETVEVRDLPETLDTVRGFFHEISRTRSDHIRKLWQDYGTFVNALLWPRSTYQYLQKLLLQCNTDPYQSPQVKSMRTKGRLVQQVQLLGSLELKGFSSGPPIRDGLEDVDLIYYKFIGDRTFNERNFQSFENNERSSEERIDLLEFLALRKGVTIHSIKRFVRTNAGKYEDLSWALNFTPYGTKTKFQKAHTRQIFKFAEKASKLERMQV